MAKAFSWFYDGGSGESSLIKSWREDYLRKQEEEKQKQIIEAQKQQNLQSGKNADGSKKDLWQQAGSIAAGVGEGLWKSGADVVGSGASLVSSIVSGDKSNDVTKQTDKWKQAADKWGNDVGANDIAATVGNLPGGIVSGIADPAAYMVRGVRNTPEMIAASIAAGSSDKNVRKAGIDEQKKLQDKLFGADVTKQGDLGMLMEGVAKPAEAIVNVLTGGSGSVATQTGKSIFKTAVKEGGKNIAAGVPTSLLEQGARGQEITPGSVAQDALMQGIIGSTISGVSGARAKSKMAKDGTTTTPDATTAPADAGQKALPAGFKDNAHYDAELQRYQQMQFTPEDNVWKDRQVTLKDGSTVDLNAIDKEINANARAMSDLQKQADGIDNNTGKATVPDGVDPSTYTGDVVGRTKAMEKVAELKAKNEQLTAVKDKAAQITGVSTEMQLDPKKVRENYLALQSEAKAAKEYNYNTSGRPVTAIKSELDALNNGDVPPELQKPLAPADNIEAVKARFNDPQVTQEVDQLRHDRYMLNDEMSRVMTPDKAQVEKAKLDTRLQEIQQELATVPEARMQYEMDSVMQEYKQRLAEIDQQVAQDAPHAQDLIRVGKELDQREQTVIARANELQAARPDMFTEPDPQLVEQRKAQLQQELADAESFTQGSKVVENVVANGENLPEKVKTDGTVKQAVATDLEDIMANAKVGDPIIGMGLRSPSQLLEKMGLGKLYSNVSRAYQSTIEHTMEDIKTIATIGKALDAEDIDGKDIIKYIRGESDTIPAKSQEVSNMVKAFFDEKRAAMESIGYKGIDNYFPEYINKEDPNFQRLFGDKENGNITFASFKHREGNLGNFNTDLVDVMRIYSQGFNKKMYLEPALKDIESIKNIKGVHETVANWTNDYLKQLKGSTKPSEMEKVFNMAVDSALGTNKYTKGMVGGSHYRTTLADARMYTSVATMGLNPATAIRNLTQEVNTVAEYGTKNSMVGMVEGTKALISGMKDKNSPQWLELKHAGVIEGGVARNYADELDKLILGQGKWAGRKVKAVDGMMAMIRWTDISLRAQAYYAAKAAGKAKGLAGQDLIDFASRGATKTQFNTSRLDMPVKLNGPGVRSLTQLATFSIKQTEFLAELGIKTFKDSKTGKFRIVPEAGNVSRLVQATALGAGMTSVLGPLIGFQADEFNPWNQQFGADSADKAIYRSPLVKLAIGDGKGKMGLFDVFNMNDDKTTPEAFQQWWSDNWNTVIPAGSQMKKMGEGFDLVSTGESQNAKGNTRFLYDNSNGFDNVKAILFGQYATKPGQEWLQGGMPTLSDKQTQQLNGLSMDKKQQYYDYYIRAKQEVKTTFATGRNEAVQKIKDTAKSNEALARQMAEEYNAKVDKQMSSYWSKHQDMPSRLKDEMFSELRIDAQKQIDAADKKPSVKSMQKSNAYALEDLSR